VGDIGGKLPSVQAIAVETTLNVYLMSGDF
jgi:hypothetical protein